MAQREDLELQRCMTPKRSEKCGQKGGQLVPQGNRRKRDNSQFINQIGVCETHKWFT
jgi:hypothetical protein